MSKCIKLTGEIGSSSALKIYVTSCITGTPVEKTVDGSRCGVSFELPDYSPCSILTSPNTISWYLLKEHKSSYPDNSDVDMWLEWEDMHLKPAVESLLPPNKKKLDLCLLEKLNDHLAKQDSSFILGKSISVADIVIWATLQSEEVVACLSQYSSIIRWLNKLNQFSTFQEALRTVYPHKLVVKSKKGSVVTESIPSEVNTTINYSDQLLGEDGEQISTAGLENAYDYWLNGKSQLPLPKKQVDPILPIPGERNVLITSSLPYVNNVPHLGNIIGCVLSADVFARFCRLRGYNTLYICGTDEYGTATETKALEEGITPQQICDKYFEVHSQVYEWFNISFNYFGRSATEQQTKVSQQMFWELYNNGNTLAEAMDQLYCQKCNKFLADRFVEGICPFCTYEDARGDQCDKCGKLINTIELQDPRCKLCGTKPIVKSSNHLFINLPKIEPKLRKYLDDVAGGWSPNAKAIARTWIKDGLKPRCITRDLKWGTPVPLEGYTDKVFYVWFDAPIGYLSITATYTDQWEKWWKNPKEVVHYEFMAKDNVPFHGVVFPCSQLGTEEDYTIVSHLMATEYLNYEDGKFSKSRGVGVFGTDAKDTNIPADVWRFYLLFIRPESQDSAFSWADLQFKINSELLNNLGNFINRVLTFVDKNFGGVIPNMDLDIKAKTLLAQINREIDSYVDLLEHAKLRDALRCILRISGWGNQYMQFQTPWLLVKGSDEEKAYAGTALGVCANIVCALSVLLQPYMPSVAEEVQKQLNAPALCNVMCRYVVCHLPVGHRIGKPSPLFQKIEQSEIDNLRQKFAGQQKSTSPSPSQSPVINNHGDVKQQTFGNEEEVTKLVSTQGNHVRQLKSSGAPKEVVDGAVAKLLEFKCLLAAIQGKDITSSSGSKKKGKKKTPN